MLSLRIISTILLVSLVLLWLACYEKSEDPHGESRGSAPTDSPELEGDGMDNLDSHMPTYKLDEVELPAKAQRLAKRPDGSISHPIFGAEVRWDSYRHDDPKLSGSKNRFREYLFPDGSMIFIVNNDAFILMPHHVDDRKPRP